MIVFDMERTKVVFLFTLLALCLASNNPASAAIWQARLEDRHALVSENVTDSVCE